MDLDTYEEWAWQEMMWVREKLLAEGIEALRATYERLGEPELRAYHAEKSAEIDKILGTPRNRRGSLVRKIVDDTERHAFLLSTAYTVQHGTLLLSLATKYGFSGSSGLSRSLLLRQAARIVEEIDASERSMWPFDDD